MVETVFIHPFASVTVTEYVPDARDVAFAVFPPVGSHENVYGDVPPVAFTDAAPLCCVHVAGVLVTVEYNAAAGCVTIADVFAEQWLASVTVKEYVPAASEVAVGVVSPLGLQA